MILYNNIIIYNIYYIIILYNKRKYDIINLNVSFIIILTTKYNIDS